MKKSKTLFSKKSYLILASAVLALCVVLISQINELTKPNKKPEPTVQHNTIINDKGKHKGMSVFGWSKNNTENIKELINNNIEWVAVIPFMFQKSDTTALVQAPKTPIGYSKRDSSFIKIIQELHGNGIRVHLKPHLWMHHGWRSDISHADKKAWTNWFESYSINILRYARMAELTHTELFCIGTELHSSILTQPQLWVDLIKEIKQIYSGKLTYAANWYGEYGDVPFWDQLDYIGIQAYFPLTKHNTPSLQEIELGWDRHLVALNSFHVKYRKPILFTEIGYRSVVNATVKPWEWNTRFNADSKIVSNKVQKQAFEAFFNKVWIQSWFKGGYIWQWDHRTTLTSKEAYHDFSPRFKPAQEIIKKHYAKDNIQLSNK